MRDDDWVIGLRHAGTSRCYPAFMLDNYHVVNDSVEGVPLAVMHCEICCSNAVFRAELSGERLSFGTGGLYGATLAVRDQGTGSLWSHGMGLALEGPLVGTQLPRVQSFQASYAEWLGLYPDTEVMVWPGPDSHPDPRHGHGADATFALGGMERLVLETMTEPEDERLPEDELVLTIFAGGGAAALPLQDLYAAGDLVSATVAGTPTVTLGAGVGSALAGTYVPRLAANPTRRLELSADGGRPHDRESGSELRVDGLFVSGPLRGERLQPVPTMLNKWHSLTSFLPGVPLIAVDRGRRPYEPLPAALRAAFDEISAVTVARVLRSHYGLELPPGAAAGVRLALDEGQPVDLFLFEDHGAGLDLAAATEPSLASGDLVLAPAPQADDSARRRCEEVFETIELGLSAAAPESPPPPVSELTGELAAFGFEARAVRPCPRDSLPVGCLSGAEIEIAGDPFIAYRFRSDADARRRSPDPAHSVAAGPFVLRSDPADVYRNTARRTLRRSDSEISWSPLLEDEAFAESLAQVVAAARRELPA